ncbi:unnamed protein product, partial [Mesorhabditis belari]|uniref:Uncharacterized protein n=1 Tax=Mesorhabditis belari TaxID=2138241 RepID=A0AAF3EUN2_9BILA
MFEFSKKAWARVMKDADFELEKKFLKLGDDDRPTSSKSSSSTEIGSSAHEVEFASQIARLEEKFEQLRDDVQQILQLFERNE